MLKLYFCKLFPLVGHCYISIWERILFCVDSWNICVSKKSRKLWWGLGVVRCMNVNMLHWHHLMHPNSHCHDKYVWNICTPTMQATDLVQCNLVGSHPQWWFAEYIFGDTCRTFTCSHMFWELLCWKTYIHSGHQEFLVKMWIFATHFVVN